jgi:hypothetical protein
MLGDSIASEQIGPPLSDKDKALINQRLEALQKDQNPGDDAEAVQNDLERSLTMLLRIRQEASLDLLEAARWYESQQSGIGRDFLAEVRLAAKEWSRE